MTAVTAPRILVFIYHLWHNDYRKEILFAGFVETTEMSLTTHSCHKNGRERRLLVLPRMTCEDIVVVNRNCVRNVMDDS